MRSFPFFYRAGVGLSLLALAGCVDPYLPDVADTGTNFLVVDGFINGNGRTRIQLSRSISVGSTATPPAEKNARLFVADEAGTRYALTELSSGRYQSDSVLLSPTHQYQLLLTTAAGVAYSSPLVPLNVTPPIDQLRWQLSGDDVRVLLSTHAAPQQARYYRWGFVETWEFNSAFDSSLQYNPTTKQIEGRLVPVYTCWRTERPSAIKQASTAQLSQNAITDQQLLIYAKRAERFKIRYSVLVSQYAETAEEFTYYDQLRKNTEAVGTVNDPLPTQLTGNVRRTDGTAETVLGFVGAHTVQQQRIFIDNQALPFINPWEYENPYSACTMGFEDLVAEKITAPNTIIFRNPNSVPISAGSDPTSGHDGYYGSTAFCVDCRTRGSNVKPSFW